MAAEPGGKGGAPLVVAWDTCTVRGVLAAGVGGTLLDEASFEATKGHTTWLMPELDAMVRGLGFTPGDIGAVAAGIGPGTFTGVKVGVACAKAVSMGLGVPVAGIPTLDILAAAADPEADAVLATLDARRGQFYAAAYRRADGRLERLTDYLCGEPPLLARAVAGVRFRTLALAGEVPGRLEGEMKRRGRVLPAEVRFPPAAALLALAGSLLSSGAGADPASLAPIYLKKPT